MQSYYHTRNPTLENPILTHSNPLMPPRRRESKTHLERVINEPLKRGQGSDHQDPDRQPIPETRETNTPVDARHRPARALAGFPLRVQLRDHDVGRVRDDGARDARDVPAEEGDTSLLEWVVGGFRLSEGLV